MDESWELRIKRWQAAGILPGTATPAARRPESNPPSAARGAKGPPTPTATFTPATGASLERVSLSNFGTQGNSISHWASVSGDGRYVVFSSDATNLVANDTNAVRDVFERGWAGLISVSTIAKPA